MDVAFKFMDVGLEAVPSQGFAHDNNQEDYMLSFTGMLFLCCFH